MKVKQGYIGNSSSTSYYVITNCNQETDGAGGSVAQFKSKFYPSYTWNSHAKCALNFKHTGTGAQRYISFEHAQKTVDGSVANPITDISGFGPWVAQNMIDVTALGVGEHVIDGSAFGSGTGITIEVKDNGDAETWTVTIWVYVLEVVGNVYAQNGIALRNVTVTS